MNDYVIFWLLVSIGCAFFELAFSGLFYFLSFAAGAVIAALVSIWTCSIEIQIACFMIGSALTFFALRRWVLSHGHNGHKTNVDALVGKIGVVTQAISSDSSGQVKVEGQAWSAKSVHSITIAEGARVKVIRIIGVHLIVDEIV